MSNDCTCLFHNKVYEGKKSVLYRTIMVMFYVQIQNVMLYYNDIYKNSRNRKKWGKFPFGHIPDKNVPLILKGIFLYTS